MLDKNRSLVTLIEEWERIARRAFYDASCEQHPIGKHTAETKAFTFARCARELRIVLGFSPEPFSPTIQKPD